MLFQEILIIYKVYCLSLRDSCRKKDPRQSSRIAVGRRRTRISVKVVEKFDREGGGEGAFDEDKGL